MFVYKYPNKLNKDGLNNPKYFVSQHRFYMYNITRISTNTVKN